MPNGVIVGYQVSYFPTANSSAVTTLNTGSSALEFDLTSLTAFTNYSISVAGITVALGTASDTITVVTSEGSKFVAVNFGLQSHPLPTSAIYCSSVSAIFAL